MEGVSGAMQEVLHALEGPWKGRKIDSAQLEPQGLPHRKANVETCVHCVVGRELVDSRSPASAEIVHGGEVPTDT